MLNDVEPLLGELGQHIEYVQPLTQEKTIKPSTEIIEVIPDEEYTGLSKIIIEGVTSDIDENIQPDNIIKGVSILGVDGLADVDKPWYITDARYLFYGNARINIINELLSKFKDCTNFYGMCSNASLLEEMPIFDSSKGTNFERMFEYCYKLKTVGYFDTSNGTNFDSMFQNCSVLTTIPQLDTSQGTNFNSMFRNCSVLTTIPQLDTSQGTNFGSMFQNCSALTSVPELDTSNGTNFNSMFRNCSALTSVPELDTSNGTNFGSMFYYCQALTTIPQLDTSQGTNFNSMFRNCSALTTIDGFKDLGKAYTKTSNNYSDYKLDLHESTLLTHDSLMNVINKLYDLNLTYDVANGGTLYSQQLVLGSTNIAKLTAEEIAIATNKGWTVS